MKHFITIAAIALTPVDATAQNAYGLGISADAYGRSVDHGALTRITPNKYGPGVHFDQYGRAIRFDNNGN